MFDIITIGSATVDAFVDTASNLFKGKKHLSVPFGSKVLIKDLRFEVGGGGVNTAIAFCRMGFKTGFIGKMGQGNNSERILKVLRQEKVTPLVVRIKGRTGFSIILDAQGYERIVLIFRGSNDDLRYDEIKRKNLQTNWFYFGTMLGESFKTQEKLAQYAKKHHIKIMFNPSSYLAQRGKAYLQNILRYVNILIVNKEEAQGIVKKNKNIKQLLKELILTGPEIAVITNGKNGAWSSDGQSIYFIRTQPVKKVETTGVGDAFASGFLSALIKRGDLALAMQVGLVNAQNVLRFYGARNKLLSWSEAMEAVKKAPPVNSF